MQAKARPTAAPLAKLLAGLLILVCLALGVIGLLLPIVPGLLFLALAALIAAQHSAPFDRWLRRRLARGDYGPRADVFLGLPMRKKVQMGCLLSLKMLLRGITFSIAVAAKLSRAARRLASSHNTM